MKHLLSFSVYQDLPDLVRGDPDPVRFLSGIGCDGLELFTSFDDVPQCYFGCSVSAHLPYAVDWYRAWSGRMTGNYAEGELDYITFGSGREEMVGNLRKGISKASVFNPAYGVIHAGNTDLEHVMHRGRGEDDRKVLEAFAEMMNQSVSGFRGGEPPFKLAFENLWWSGLKLVEPWEYRLLAHSLEFDNWGFCLDTGHLMNTLPDAFDQESAIDGVLKVIDGYPKDMADRIGTMHFHYSASAEYRNTFEEKDTDPDAEDLGKIIERSYAHVGRIDQHLPFTDPRCKEIVDALRPEYLTHEMINGDILEGFATQRSLFDGNGGC